MAGIDYHLHAYVRQLNDYHIKLLSCASLTAHLLDQFTGSDAEEWQSSGCFLMREMLTDLAENLPFPDENVLNYDVKG